MDVDLQLLEVPRLLTAGSMYPFRTLARCVALSPPLRRQTGEFGGAVGDDTDLYQNLSISPSSRMVKSERNYARRQDDTKH
jgi:hypothetical protein